MFGTADADYVDFEMSQKDEEYEEWLSDVSNPNDEELNGMLSDMYQNAV